MRGPKKRRAPPSADEVDRKFGNHLQDPSLQTDGRLSEVGGQGGASPEGGRSDASRGQRSCRVGGAVRWRDCAQLVSRHCSGWKSLRGLQKTYIELSKSP